MHEAAEATSQIVKAVVEGADAVTSVFVIVFLVASVTGMGLWIAFLVWLAVRLLF